ncbi:MAG: DUF6338 family protein [Pseudohongiellaceae bacterium]
MNDILDIIPLLEYLLPGFLAAGVFYGFTSYPKPSAFERVVQALIFVFLAQIFVGIIKIIWEPSWSETSEIIWSVSIAVLLGIIFSLLANYDWLHRFLRFIRITKETSFPSEWYGAFSDPTYIVIHLKKDGKRLYGWPKEWPSDPANGHFIIQDPSWVKSDGTEERIRGVEYILIDVNAVRWVEFLNKTQETRDGQKST